MVSQAKGKGEEYARGSFRGDANVPIHQNFAFVGKFANIQLHTVLMVV